MDKLTHLNAEGEANMVDVGGKPPTRRRAVAQGSIRMSKEAYQALKEGSLEKGDALAVARVAGIMAAKKTSGLIPLCHPLALTRIAVDFTWQDIACTVGAVCTVECLGQTGVEMEALIGVNIALLSLYDMCKAVDKQMVLGDICLLEKSGGKSGDYGRNAHD